MYRFLALFAPVFIFASTVSQASAKDALTLESLDRLKTGVKEHVLSNGLKILFYERDVAPVFSGISSVRVGGVNEQPGVSGASHLFEHLAFKGGPDIGTKDYGREKPLLVELETLRTKQDEAIKNKGTGLTEEETARLKEVSEELAEIWKIAEFTNLHRKWGASGLNATTAKELTNYFASYPVTSFEFWCWAESERLARPVARQFYKERDVVLEERRSRYEDSPSGKLYEKLLGQAFLQHPYRHPVIGYESDIRSLQPRHVLDLHKEYYVGSNIVVAVVGDMEFEEALPTLKKYFGRIPSGKRPEQPTVVEPPQEGERNFSITFDASPVFFAGYKKPIYPDPREPALTLFLEIAMGSRVAPLYKEIVLNKKMASSLGYFEAPGDMFPNLVIMYGEPIKPFTNEQLLTKFDQELEKVISKPISEKELQIAKRGVMKGALVGMKSNMGLARELADIEQKFGSWRVLLEWYKQMLQVTPEQAQQAAKEILQNDQRTVGFLSRKGGKA